MAMGFTILVLAAVGGTLIVIRLADRQADPAMTSRPPVTEQASPRPVVTRAPISGRMNHRHGSQRPPSHHRKAQHHRTQSEAPRVFPLSGCTFGYGRTHHDYPAADIFAPR